MLGGLVFIIGVTLLMKMNKNTYKIKECQCDVVVELINNENTYAKYLEYIKRLDEMENVGILELYAGDSYLDDIQEHCKKEDRYTINHYYRCKRCKKVFFIGFCCRGGFIFKVKEFPINHIKSLEDIDFEHIMGDKEKIGVRFNNKRRYH